MVGGTLRRMTETEQPSNPTPPNPWAERRTGLLWILGLHLVFTAATRSLGFVVPIDDADAENLLHTWIRWLGVLQGIYVIPACLTAALVQRWQVLAGMCAAAVATGIATGIALTVGG